jgi:hypothetical protein
MLAAAIEASLRDVDTAPSRDSEVPAAVFSHQPPAAARPTRPASATAGAASASDGMVHGSPEDATGTRAVDAVQRPIDGRQSGSVSGEGTGAAAVLAQQTSVGMALQPEENVEQLRKRLAAAASGERPSK